MKWLLIVWLIPAVLGPFRVQDSPKHRFAIMDQIGGRVMKEDIEILQGTWEIVSLEMEGQKMTEAMFAGSKIVVQGNHFTTIAMGATYRGTVELDASHTPKTFDLLFSEGPEKGNRSLGIYELNGDTWRMCLTTRGTTRPSKFAAEPGTGIALQILKREMTPSGRSASTRPQASAPGKKGASGPSTEPTELEGEWSMVSGVTNGQPFDPNGVKYGKRITKGNVTTVVFGPQVFLKVRFSLDRSTTPMSIDYVNLQGPSEGKTQLGIYETDGKTLKVCTAPVGHERPADFTSKPGDGRTLTVWKKD